MANVRMDAVVMEDARCSICAYVIVIGKEMIAAIVSNQMLV